MRKGLVVAVVVLVLVLFVLPTLMHVAPFSCAGNGSTVTAPHTIHTSTNAPSTTTPTYVRLGSLNGTIHCLDGDTITRVLWARMRDFNASDYRINVYTAWIKHALAREPIYALTADPKPKVEFKSGIGRVVDDLGYEYWWVDAYGWRAEPPSMDGIVRMGVIKLGFGTGIIVTAYQVGNHVDVVVHGTVINTTKYRETAMLRALAGDCPCDPQTKFFPKPSAVLYRIRLEGHGSYLRAGNVTLPIKNIYVLVEIPIAITPPDQTVGGDRIELFMPEYVGWMIIGRPALGLAIHLAYPPGTNPLTLYKQLVVPLTLDVVTRGTYYLSNPAKISDITYVSREETPLTLRDISGVCHNHATAESNFASIALGAITAPFGDPAHKIALLVLPSTVFGKVRTSAPDIEGLPGRGPINTYHDVDGDNVTDAGIILANTAPPDYTLKRIEYELKMASKGGIGIYEFRLLNGDTLTSRLVDATGLTWGGWLYVMGFTDYVRSLPDWLAPPWYPALEEKVYSKIVKPPAPDKLKYVAVPFGMALGDAEEALNATMSPEKLAVPSYRLAVGNVINAMPTVDAGVKTPPIIFWQLLRNNTTTQTSGSQPGNTGTPTETPLPPALVTAVINASWNGHAYKGNTTVNGVPITVIVWRGSTGGWAVDVWVGGDDAYVGPATIKNHTVTAWFTWKGTTYRVTAHLIGGPLNGQQ